MATADTPPGDEANARYQQRIRAALLEGYGGFTKLWEDAYRVLAAHLGMRVREPLTFRQLSVAVGALAEGCSLRQRVDERMEGILRPTGSEGEDEEWTLFAIGLEALLQTFFELDPDWTPPAAAGADGVAD